MEAVAAVARRRREAVVAAAVAAAQIGGLETAPAVVASQVSVAPGLEPMSSIAAVAAAVVP